MNTTQTITNTDIAQLRDEAARAGDRKGVALCVKALGGNKRARTRCVAMILDARAMLD